LKKLKVFLCLEVEKQIIEKNIDLSLASNIIIDTIHSIKGGEAQHVCVYEKANWPAHFENKVGLARSSESRVWYVAVTRAKDKLYLSLAQYDKVKKIDYKPSQFLHEAGLVKGEFVEPEPKKSRKKKVAEA